MDDKPEKPDLPILHMQAYLTWNEVDGLLFHHAYKQGRRGLNDVRRGVQNLFEEALLNTGELTSEAVTSSNTPIYQKIKKGEMCGWLIGKRVLALLEEKGLTVPIENKEIIVSAYSLPCLFEEALLNAGELRGDKSPYKGKAVKKKQAPKKKPKEEVKPPKSGRGRPAFSYSGRFKDEVNKLHKSGVSKGDIPYRASITSLLNPGATNQGKAITKDEYKDTYKNAFSTVYGYVVKAIKEGDSESQ
jgi:hypothetical protein